MTIFLKYIFSLFYLLAVSFRFLSVNALLAFCMSYLSYPVPWRVVAFFLTHTMYLGGRIGAGTGCAECRRVYRKTVSCENNTHVSHDKWGYRSRQKSLGAARSPRIKSVNSNEHRQRIACVIPCATLTYTTISLWRASRSKIDHWGRTGRQQKKNNNLRKVPRIPRQKSVTRVRNWSDRSICENSSPTTEQRYAPPT